MLTITRALAPDPAVRGLIDELEAELSAHYPAEQRHGLKLEAIFRPHIHFFVGSWHGEPAGCGGVALFDGFAELKRMYVRAELRGLGIASALLERLQAVARGAGIAQLFLETGTSQHAALRFYAREGFVTCPAFGDYAAMPQRQIAGSIFMRKDLA